MNVEQIKKLIYQEDPLGIASAVPNDEFDDIANKILHLDKNDMEVLNANIFSLFVVAFGIETAGTPPDYQKLARELHELQTVTNNSKKSA